MINSSSDTFTSVTPPESDGSHVLDLIFEVILQACYLRSSVRQGMLEESLGVLCQVKILMMTTTLLPQKLITTVLTEINHQKVVPVKGRILSNHVSDLAQRIDLDLIGQGYLQFSSFCCLPNHSPNQNCPYPPLP